MSSNVIGGPRSESTGIGVVITSISGWIGYRDPVDPNRFLDLNRLIDEGVIHEVWVVAHQVGVNAVQWDTPIVSELPWFALSDPLVTRMVTVGDMRKSPVTDSQTDPASPSCSAPKLWPIS